ncbi:hypothetical protein KY284_010680 [Solanum tuberosum]|nr:hypothetical protein KY284_010680 [Solanum tuberosum]
MDYVVKFSKCQNFKLQGFSDSDWGGFAEDMKSTSGYYFIFGTGCFSWCSKKQEIVAQSTAEAEFIAATGAVNQALWIKKIFCDLGLEMKESTEIFVDNQAAIAISHNPIFHRKTKHFNVKLYFLREVQEDGLVNLVYCKTKEQLANIFTKALPASKFEFLRKEPGICSF